MVVCAENLRKEQAGRGSWRRVYLAVSMLVLVLLALHSTVSFLASDAGATGTSAHAAQLYVLSPGQAVSLRTTTMTSTVFGRRTNGVDSVIASGASWTPSAQSPGSVAVPGDLALVNGLSTSSPIRVVVHITNLAALASDYSSFVLPLAVFYSATGGAGSAPNRLPCAQSGCDWRAASGVHAAPRTEPTGVADLTDGDGRASFVLPAGADYEIAIPVGGSYYCVATRVSADASLSPSFLVTID
jgi:hypothetical protein